MKATLFTDGGARGNPGPAGIGFVLKIEGKRPITYGKYIGNATNNQAEYQALIAGLSRALKERITELQVFMDSELIVQQVKGNYRIKNECLKPLYEEVMKLTGKFMNISFAHIPRSKNKEADTLVNKAIDSEF